MVYSFVAVRRNMSKIFENEDVLYLCTCGAERPIIKIYFCRYCYELRCCECVSHEVDSHYCQNCLEYMPSPEARLKKNKCSNCFDCPSCRHTLSTRATSVQVPNPEDNTKTIPKKVYYLVCGFCRWTSREVGIPDQPTATGGWQEAENIHNKRISELMEYYRQLAQKEKIERERKKISQRCSYLHISDKYRISPAVGRKIEGFPMLNTYDKGSGVDELSPAVSTNIVEPLPDSYLTEPLNLSTISSIKQQFFQPHSQPRYASQLFPKNKSLHIKRSQRCKVCEHNLSKPEYNPSSIRFKIQLAAYYHIPDLRIKCIPKLYMDKECRIELVLDNPTSHPAHLTFLSLDEVSEGLSKVKVPPCELVLAPRDDTAEFDDFIDNQGYKDDPNVVTFRKGNRLGFIITVIPLCEEAIVSFKIKHDFINTTVTLPGEPPKEPQVMWLTHTLKLNLGRICDLS